MNPHPSLVAAGGLLLSLGSLSAQAASPGEAPAPLPPGLFVENTGQWRESAARFRLLGTSLTADMESGRMRFRSGRGPDAIDLALVFPGSEPTGERALAAVNLYCGEDPELWRRDARGYGAVRYRDLADGVDLVAHVTGEGLRYDLELAAGARLEELSIQVEGSCGLAIEDGALVIDTADGTIRQSPPVAWQTGPARHNPVSCRFRILGSDRYGFAIDVLDPALPTTIDPTLQADYASYFLDVVKDLEIDPVTGHVVACGQATEAFPPPPNPGAVQPVGDVTASSENSVAWVARIAPGQPQSLVHLTLIGGSAADACMGLALDGAGALWVAVTSTSTDFPVTMGPPAGTGRAAIVVRLDAATGALQTATRLGLDESFAYDVATGGGRVFVHGTAEGPSALLGSFGSVAGVNTFVVAVDPVSGAPTSGVLIGGDDEDSTTTGALAVDPGVAVYVGGLTASGTSFPATAGAFAVPLPGSRGNRSSRPIDGFVARFDWNLLGCQFASRLGGTGNDRLNALHFRQGRLYCCGSVGNGDIQPPAVGGDTSFAGGSDLYGDAFVGVLDFSAYVPGTAPPVPLMSFFGGGSEEDARDLAVDAAGRIHLTGLARPRQGKAGRAFPEVDDGSGLFKQGLDSPDGFLAVIDPGAAETLVYSTLLGGTDGAYEWCDAMALAGDGSVAVSLHSLTAGFTLPTTTDAVYGAWQAGLNGWIARLPAVVP